jgi:hypothetical protein
MKHFLLPNRLESRPPMGQQTMAQAMWREAVTKKLKMVCPNPYNLNFGPI